MNFYMITWVAFFSVIPTRTASGRTNLPKTLPNIIMEHFASCGSCNAYFCTVRDATTFSGVASEDSILFRTAVISTKLLSEKIVLEDTQHRLGVFVDTNCPEGITFLYHNQDLFNSSYTWLLWSGDLTLTLNALQSSRLNIDTDLTIIFRKSVEPIEDAHLDDRNGTVLPLSDELIEAFAMMEVYRTHTSTPFVLKEYQRWIGGHVYSIAPVSERFDLGGLQFNGSILLPNMNHIDIPRENLTNPAYAFNIDVRWRYGMSLFFTMCQHYMNCSIHLVESKCNDESIFVPCNNSMGVIDLVQSSEADFAIVPLTWDRFKAEHVDYTLPIMNIKHKYAFRRPKMVDSCLALIRPLSPEIWLLLAGLMILAVVAFRVVAPYDDSSLHNDGWGGSAFLVLSALAQQGIPDNAYKLTTRIIYLCILGVTFLVYAYYSTALLNGLLLPPPHSIQFASQLYDSQLTLGLQDSPTLQHRLTQNEDLDTGLRLKLSSLPLTDVFTEANAGVERIVREPFAIFVEELTLNERLWKVRMTYAEMCSVGFVDDEQLPNQASFIIRSNSPYKELLRRGVIRTRERGAMDRLKTNWFPQVPPCLWKTDALQFGLQPHAMAYLIMAIGIVSSILVFGSEIIVFKPRRMKDSEGKPGIPNEDIVTTP